MSLRDLFGKPKTTLSPESGNEDRQSKIPAEEEVKPLEDAVPKLEIFKNCLQCLDAQYQQRLRTECDQIRDTLKEESKRKIDEIETRLKDEFSRDRDRLNRQMEESRLEVQKKLLTELIKTLDNFDQAIKSMAKSTGGGDANIEGIKQIQKQLLDTLEVFGLQRMESSVGKVADPNLHDTIAKCPVTEEYPDGYVAEEICVGYTLHGQKLREAKVIVASEDVSQNA